LYNGEQGKTWDVDTNGKPFLTDEAWNYVNDINLELPEGGKWGDGIRLLGFNGLSLAFVNPKTQEPISYQLWESTKKHVIENQTNLQKDWTSVTGYQYTIDYVKENNLYTEMPLAKSLVKPMSDEISSQAARIGDIVKENSWKMVFAKDDTEFESIYKDMVNKAEGLGLKEVYESSLEGWNNAKELADKYK
jgi:putative aldouronate transport system substrate-binding protein